MAGGDRRDRVDQGLAVDADEHDPVAQPLVHTDAEPRGDRSHRVSERDELGHRFVVATSANKVGEPTEV
jgi:hypothetical protein